MTGALAAGFGLGFLTAAQVGPIWLLCLRSTLRGGFRIGVAIGAGAAVIDVLYAALGVAGASRLLEIDPLRVALGLVGAAVLALLGLKTLASAFRVRLGGEVAEEVASPRRAFVTSLGATASNPMTIAAWAAIFSAASTASVVGTSRATASSCSAASASARSSGSSSCRRGLRRGAGSSARASWPGSTSSPGSA